MVSKPSSKKFIGERWNRDIPLLFLRDCNVLQDEFEDLVIGTEAYTLWASLSLLENEFVGMRPSLPEARRSAISTMR